MGQRARFRWILLLGVLAGGCTTGPASSPPVQATFTPQPAPATSPERSVQPTIAGQIGEPLEVPGAATLTVGYASAWKGHNSQLAGYRYVVLQLTVKATGREAVELSAESFALLDLSRQAYPPLATGAGPALPLAVAMGKTATGKLTFEIPTGGNYELQFRPSAGGVIGIVDVTKAIAAIQPSPSPTPRRTATPRPTAGAVTGGGSGSGGWDQAAHATAVAYQQSAIEVYAVDLPGRTNELAYWTCGLPDECAAGREYLTAADINPATAALKAHIAFMKSHPAARCFRDAYAADRSIANGYLTWLAGWKILNGTESSDGRGQIMALDDLDGRADAFLATDWYRDCR